MCFWDATDWKKRKKKAWLGQKLCEKQSNSHYDFNSSLRGKQITTKNREIHRSKKKMFKPQKNIIKKPESEKKYIDVRKQKIRWS